MKEELWLLASIPNQKKKKMKLFPAPTIWKQACFPDCWACLLWSAASDQREAELAPEGGGEKVSDVDSRRLCWVIWGRGWWGKLICSPAKPSVGSRLLCHNLVLGSGGTSHACSPHAASHQLPRQQSCCIPCILPKPARSSESHWSF